MATAKRTLEGYDDPATAWELIKQQREVDSSKKRKYQDLYNASKVSKVPYLGTLEPGERPGKAINVVGFPDLKNLLKMWFRLKPGEQLLVVGPKGDGKSCRLRALASLICTACDPTTTVVACIWSMERARNDLVNWLVHALRVAYAQKPDVAAQVDESVNDLASLAAFLGRRRDRKDDITFIVEDAQGRGKCYKDLMDVIQHYKVVFGISPKAMQYKEYQRTRYQGIKIKAFATKGFTKEQVQTFLKEVSVLGAVVGDDPERCRQLEHYAGNHPHSLDILDQACVKVARDKIGSEEGGELVEDPESGYLTLVDEPPDLTPEEVAELLSSSEDWDTVISTFVADEHFEALRISIRDFIVVGDFSTDRQIIFVDPRYAYKDRFVTSFIQQLYVEEFRAKEQDSADYGPWLNYSKIVIRSPTVNWSETGWLCERLCNDVISRKGMCIEPSGFSLGMLSATPFSSIPGFVDTDRINGGRGYMFMPVRYNYGQVDAVIFYRDTAGVLHLIGLQYTTSLEKHMHSESEFMSIRMLEKWYKNILDESRSSRLELDYVFVCTNTKDPEVKQEDVRQLRDQSFVGILKHTRHVISFEDALNNRVSTDVMTVLREMAVKRERCFEEFPGVAEPVLPPPQGNGIELKRSQLKALKRHEANALAINANIDPSTYRRVEELKEKLVKEKVIVIVS